MCSEFQILVVLLQKSHKAVESLVIRILNEVCTAAWQLRLKRGKHILSVEEEKIVIRVVNCFISAGWEPHIGGKPPQGCLLTNADMMRDISAILNLLDEWERLLTTQQVFDSLTDREMQLFELLAMNTNKEVAKITGFEFTYIKTIRTRINSKTQCTNPVMLRAFYYTLLDAGVKIPSWNAKMKKKIRVC